MFLKTPSIVLLATGIVTLNLLSTGSMGESVCANWWKSLPAGQKPPVNVALAPQRNKKESGAKLPGRINGNLAGRNTTFLSPGAGACGITYTDEDKGACLWGGLNSVEPIPQGQQSGWLTGTNTKNCGKKFFINRGKHRATGKFLDSCSLEEDKQKLTLDQGCSTIYVTRATFIKLGGDPGGSGRIQIDNWDFDASTPPE
ncbi:hypothetical protein PGTUg99_009857 [Puccinia graminis f. sp. tritici]|uniref:Pectate lyase n=1 Tax=Puccinia graminis f. sp. tritici TaxID=56615 RepID=A0A5B0SGI7_PUCGR|nr:hypothetical protein PGTUg99_009857 [Puccinia graminis f. sp. tritici]